MIDPFISGTVWVLLFCQTHAVLPDNRIVCADGGNPHIYENQADVISQFSILTLEQKQSATIWKTKRYVFKDSALIPFDETAPDSVMGLNAVAVSSNSVKLSWLPGTDNEAVAGYLVRRNNSVLITVLGTGVTDVGLDPSTSYFYTVTAFDASGNEGLPNIGVFVKTLDDIKDKTMPTTSITSPANNVIVSSTVVIKANAADNVGIASVLFSIEGVPTFTDYVAPYTFNWDTTKWANGTVALTATAMDASNNMKVSAPIVVIINNIIP